MTNSADNPRIQKVYEETSRDLNSIYKKRRITGVFQKLMWLIFGLYFVAVILFMLAYYLKYDFGFITDYLNDFESDAKNPYKRVYPLAGLLILLMISTSLFPYFFRKYKTLESETIMKMTRGLFPNSEFTQVSQIETNKVAESRLFPWIKKGTPVYTFGQMRTKVNGTKIQVADIGFLEENVGNKILKFLLYIPGLNMFVMLYQYVFKNIFTSKSADNVYYTFRGMYGWTSFNKPLNSHTVVVPNTFSSKSDRIASFKFKQEEKVLMEDARFTNYFSTYGTDQVEARYVLSSKMMEKIVELRERFGRDIMLSFQNNKLFVAVENPNGLFSFPAGRLDSIEILEEIVSDINAMESIVEEFDLSRTNSVQ